jgi:hypothetical protein
MGSAVGRNARGAGGGRAMHAMGPSGGPPGSGYGGAYEGSDDPGEADNPHTLGGGGAGAAVGRGGMQHPLHHHQHLVGGRHGFPDADDDAASTGSGFSGYSGPVGSGIGTGSVVGDSSDGESLASGPFTLSRQQPSQQHGLPSLNAGGWAGAPPGAGGFRPGMPGPGPAPPSMGGRGFGGGGGGGVAPGGGGFRPGLAPQMPQHHAMMAPGRGGPMLGSAGGMLLGGGSGGGEVDSATFDLLQEVSHRVQQFASEQQAEAASAAHSLPPYAPHSMGSGHSHTAAPGSGGVFLGGGAGGFPDYSAFGGAAGGGGSGAGGGGSWS